MTIERVDIKAYSPRQPAPSQLGNLGVLGGLWLLSRNLFPEISYAMDGLISGALTTAIATVKIVNPIRAHEPKAKKIAKVAAAILLNVGVQAFLRDWIAPQESKIAFCLAQTFGSIFSLYLTGSRY